MIKEKEAVSIELSDEKYLQKAIEIATQSHEGQMRESGEPYITHPIAVMKILEEFGFPPIALACAVLHDVCEDTHTTSIEMSNMFPERVAFVVYALSKHQKPKDNEQWRKLYKEAKERKENNTTSFEEYIDYRFLVYIRRFYLGCIADPYVMYVKMADQIHNLSDMESLSKKKKERKLKEVEDHFLPLYKKMNEFIMPDGKEEYEKLLEQFITIFNKETEKLKKAS